MRIDSSTISIVESIERSLQEAIDNGKKRKAEIWAELHSLFWRQERRDERARRLRVTEDERERELRAELRVLEDDDGSLPGL